MSQRFDRFSMALALVDRARAHQLWIGDDHGDKYEQAIDAETIPEEMQIVVKEAIDHLRASLDYCALEIWQRFSGKPDGARIYFPIASPRGKEGDFLSLMNRNMPGVAAASTKAFVTLKGFQVFTDLCNSWLPELASLVNQTKHDHLEVVSIPNTLINMSDANDGRLRFKFASGHGPKRGRRWMKIKATEEFLPGGTYEVLFLQLKSIEMELATFLQEAIVGVRDAVEQCRSLCR